MLKELVITLDSSEKHSFYRFFSIILGVFVALFLALSTLYYYKERQRLYHEKQVEYRLAFSKCKHLQKLLHATSNCKMQVVILTFNDVKAIYLDILYAFLLSFILMLVFAYFLAKLALRPMQESVLAMDGFINGIVHDINTPLSVIRMSAQSIQKQVKDTRLQTRVTRLLNAVEQVESLEEQLLFSIKIGQYQLQKEPFNLGKMLQERQAYYASLRHSITLHVNSADYDVIGDKLALLRMVDNIVLNAIKYSYADKKIRISIENNHLTIQDEGPGIKHPKKIFQKYYREALENKGIGLGLYIVQHVASLHHLVITVDSTLGVGTTFRVNLLPIKNSTTSKL